MNGLLLVNLGTPDGPDTGAVRRYLRQFLSDPRVLDINPIGRAALLHLVILPFRPSKSAAAYRQIWTERGSPLLFHSLDLTAAVQGRLGAGWRVELGMRYGAPSIASALERLRTAGADRTVVFPLYPQYSSSATGSTVEEVFRVTGQLWVTPNLSFVEPFFDDPGFIEAFAVQGEPVLAAENPDRVLFSFHGLPERHLRRGDESGGRCFAAPDCCATVDQGNRSCYRAQCHATARALMTRLGLDEERCMITFQSRLGRTPWIRPFTDVALEELAGQGIKKVVVFCPAFVADCLETIEEIGLRGRRSFLDRGGESLTLVPSLNSTPAWADAVVALVRRQAHLYGEAA